MRRKSAKVAIACVGLMAALYGTDANAFEQTTIPAGKTTKSTGLLIEQPLPGVELTTPAQTGNGEKTGLGIVFPGLGSFGALPKLDFGLELLYGAPDAKVTGEAPGELPPDALTVYGSVKKTF